VEIIQFTGPEKVKLEYKEYLCKIIDKYV